MSGAHDEAGRRVPDEARSSIIGRFLRRSRLDELPQLFSILAGEMSFVGPRPLLPVDQAPEHKGRLLVRPGLTGWAQVHGGRDISAADKAAMDLWYVRNASFRLDLLIAIKTVQMLFVGEKSNAEVIALAWRDAELCLSAGFALSPRHDASELAFEEGARGLA
jgi:lipopolysaccharide/colanic/teichoic acid biosynthesis glycosyltransferase